MNLLKPKTTRSTGGCCNCGYKPQGGAMSGGVRRLKSKRPTRRVVGRGVATKVNKYLGAGYDMEGAGYDMEGEGFFGDLWSGVKKVARVAAPLASFVPGVGPIARAGLSALAGGRRPRVGRPRVGRPRVGRPHVGGEMSGGVRRLKSKRPTRRVMGRGVATKVDKYLGAGYDFQDY